MERRNRNYRPDVVISKPTRRLEERQVFGNLAVTPAKMLEMAEKGLPISTQNMSMTTKDGDPNPSWELTTDQIRGIDPATLWEQQKLIKMKARKGLKRDIELYGE